LRVRSKTRAIPRWSVFAAVLALVLFVLAVGAAEAGKERDGTASAEGRSTPCSLPCRLDIGRTGSGRVISEPAMVDCGATCVAWLNPGDVFTLIAEPASGENFSSWGDCPLADGPRCTLEIVGPACVSANFTGSAPPLISCGTAGPSPPPGMPPPLPDDHPPLGTRCTIVGSPGGEVLRGTSGLDVICGRGGNDRIYGGAGHDLILGGKGDDRLYGGLGREHLLGGPGKDVLVGGPDEDELFGEGGADLLEARDSFGDFVSGGSGRDRARVDGSDVRRGIERRLR
jgi:hypothetical protein